MSNNLTRDQQDRPPGINAVSDHFYEAFDTEMAATERQIREVYELRYQVYCIDRPFENPVCFPDKREQDGYDRRSVQGLVRHKRSGAAIAGVRLVLSKPQLGEGEFPMERPCLKALNRTAQHALDSVPREQVAELSRFAVSRSFRRRLGEGASPTGVSERINYMDPGQKGERSMPYITLGLFAVIIRLSVEYNVTHWVAVMEPALLRLLRRFGISFTHVGELVEYHGRRKPVFAEVSELLEGIRRERPDVWTFITESGRYHQARRPTYRRRSNTVRLSQPHQRMGYSHSRS